MSISISKRQVVVQAAIVAVAVVFALLAPRHAAIFRVAENWAGDMRISWLNPDASEQHPDIIILAITEETLQGMAYRSPVDRAFLAQILDSLVAKKVRAVGFDILFDQPTEPDKDALFRATAARMPFPVVLGWGEPENGLTEFQYGYQKEYLAGLTSGYSILAKDANDGTVRFTFPGRQTAGGYQRSFTTALAETLGFDVPKEQLRIVYRGRPSLDKKAFRSFPIHAAAVLPAQWFAGKVVLIGADLPLKDRHRTPFVAGMGSHDGQFPGVEIHAHILAQLMAGKLSRGSDWRFEAVVAFVLGLIALYVVFSETSLPLRITLGTATILVLVVGNLSLFAYQGMSVPLVAPAAAFAVAVGLGSAWGAAQGRHIRKAFGHYLSPVMVKQMADEGSMPEQGGELREITVWISDLENYTTLSEIYTPTELITLLNSVYSVMGDTVEEHGGFVPQFVGDAMVAAFGAPMDDPDHARHAVESALECQIKVAKVEARTDLPQGLRLRNRIGISTGTLLAGNIGSKRRLSYTVLGDDINLASRLEGVNKVYKSDILVNETTAERCGPGIRFREIDIIRVKGRNAPVRIFQPLTMNGTLSDEQEDVVAKFAEALAIFREGRFAEAGPMFDAIAKWDPVAGAFAERVRDMIENPPPADWDGINTLETK